MSSILTLITTILPIVVGPGGAIAICFCMLVFVGWLVTKHLLPSIEKRFTEAQTNISNLMVEHRADRELFRESISFLTAGQISTNVKLDALVEKVEDIADRITSHGIELKKD